MVRHRHGPPGRQVGFAIGEGCHEERPCEAVPHQDHIPAELPRDRMHLRDDSPGHFVRGLPSLVSGPIGIPHGALDRGFEVADPFGPPLFSKVPPDVMWACRLYGIGWTVSGNTISVARFEDVVKLDLVVGPKA